MRYKTMADLPKHTDFGVFNLGEAPTIDWKKAEVGLYYYLCNQLTESLYVVRDSYIVKVLMIRTTGRLKLKILELHADGSDKKNEVSEIILGHVALWPMTAQEVEEFKKSAKVRRLQIIDEF